MTLIELQKELDTIDHQILIKKMKYLDFSKNLIAWFKSYLSERKFKININTSYFSPSTMFLLYINGLLQAVVSDSLLYADDTCIIFQHENVTEIEKQLLKDFPSLCDWFVDNKLSVHFGQDKTKSILFGTKHKLRNAEALNIVYNGTEIFISNALIRPLSDYACTAWFSKLSKRLKLRHSVSQNRCIRFCLQLNK